MSGLLIGDVCGSSSSRMRPCDEGRRSECDDYFFCGSSSFSPFLKTAKMACDGQASRRSRQLSRQREESNMYGGVESHVLVGQIGTQMAWWVQRSGWRTSASRMTIIGLTPSKRPC